MRTPGVKEPPSIERRPKAEPIVIEVELITPLLGGGARPRHVDTVSWLRPSAVKSAIRAWWRIGFAHNYASPKAMRVREDVLFGARAQYDKKGNVIGGPGILSVLVESGKMTTRPYAEPVESALNGAYFPANVGKVKAELGVVGTKSKITLLFNDRLGQLVRPTDKEEILVSVQLWLTLGGVGGRTRRSAGALATTENAAKALEHPRSMVELKSFLARYCKRAPITQEMDSVFCLARVRCVFVGPEFDDEKDAHRKLLAPLRDARQDRKHPRDWKRGDWGRSRWPEADAIRLKAARTPGGTEWSHVPKAENAKQYPRAALGLPIVVYFMTTREKPNEPTGHNVYAAQPTTDGWRKINRYASPILLRIVRIWRDGRPKYVPIAIITDCTLPGIFRPLVAIGDTEDVNRHDVIADYAIRDHAHETLTRVEARYVAAGFEKIEENP